MTKDSPDQGKRARSSWRRGALRMAGLAGLAVTEIGAGIAVVTRRDRPAKIARLGSDVSLVARRGAAHREQLGQDSWLLALGPANGRPQVTPVAKHGWLVTAPGASPAEELAFDTQTSRELGLRHVSWLLNRCRIDCVLDVGANNGQYAQNLRRHGYRGHIVSFEPVPAYAAHIAELSAADPRWTVHQLALGRTEGTVPINVQQTFSSFLPSSEYGKQRFRTLREQGETETVEVPLRRLDSVLDEALAPVIGAGVAHPRLFLKMDTQGFDLEAFGGLGERVRDIAAMQSEVALLPIYEGMPRMPEAVATYEAAGFEITGLYPVNREKDGRVIEYDCVMLRSAQAG